MYVYIANYRELSDMSIFIRDSQTHNRLGSALQLSIMRYSGRVLGTDARLPAVVVAYLAEQMGVEVGIFTIGEMMKPMYFGTAITHRRK